MERTDWLAPGPWKMANPVREYDWGSTGALAALQGREPSGRPEAELWMGAHPAAPSRLRQPDGSEVSLAAAIDADPVAVLGRECTTRFGARLPFLLKVLAVARALSIQVHPSPAQAAAGFAREQAGPAAGGAPVRGPVRQAGDAPARYRVRRTGRPAPTGPDHPDASEAGRSGPPSGAAGPDVAGGTGRPGRCAGDLGRLATGSAERAGQLDLRTRTWLARRHGRKPGSDERSSLDWVITLAEQHPDDPLVVAPLLLRLYRLAPGQAIYLPHGVPHAYLAGVEVEIMASSTTSSAVA